MAAKFTTIDEYISSYPQDVRVILEKVRSTMRDATPMVGEKISYQMPTITMDGTSLVYFAGWKHHVGLYPIPPADAELEKDLAPLRAAKDALRLYYDKPIDYDLVRRLTEFLVERRMNEST